MPAPEAEAWLHSKKRMRIGTRSLRPKPHPALPETPLSISRGQAEAYYVEDSDGSTWIIKKFHSGLSPDHTYLSSVQNVLPHSPAFVSGWERLIVDRSSLIGGRNARLLLGWLDGTILMPSVQGMDWAYFADRLREDKITLGVDSRARMCRSLARAIVELEIAQCSHRDLSSGNVFVNQADWTVSLIDWDSVYHPSLTMPANTTCGTQGYIAPFVWGSSGVEASRTWCSRGDRFALALICTEMLIAQTNAPFAGDGGLFEQSHLRNRHGNSLDYARQGLARQAPAAAPLFDRALGANSYDDCPSPQDWFNLGNSLIGEHEHPPEPLSTDWMDSGQFWIDLATRPVLPPVLDPRITLPEQWSVQMTTAADHRIVLPENWSGTVAKERPKSDSKIILPENWES